MALTNTEREKINDSILKLQSAQASLEGVDTEEVPGMEELEDCLDAGSKDLKKALRK
jgi:hypothetical protein